MEYSEKVFDHFTNPRNVGEIPDANGVGEVGNAKCGDIMKIYLKVSDDGIIEDVKFKTFGCGAAMTLPSIFRNIFIMSPHLGLPTSPMPSAFSISPTLRGFAK